MMAGFRRLSRSVRPASRIFALSLVAVARAMGVLEHRGRGWKLGWRRSVVPPSMCVFNSVATRDRWRKIGGERWRGGAESESRRAHGQKRHVAGLGRRRGPWHHRQRSLHPPLHRLFPLHLVPPRHPWRPSKLPNHHIAIAYEAQSPGPVPCRLRYLP